MSKVDWKQVKEYQDITYHKSYGVARIAFNRPEVRNAFRPDTLLGDLSPDDVIYQVVAQFPQDEFERWAPIFDLIFASFQPRDCGGV